MNLPKQPLSPYPRIHLIGAGGSGMAPLAKLLSGLGHDVSGSDLKPGKRLEALGDLNIGVWVGHRPEEAASVDLVVVSSAVPDSDPEVRAARSAGIPVWRRPLLLDAVTAVMPAVGFTGTHGKTTSTALAVTALRAGGADPTFIVGSDLLDLNTSAHFGDPNLFMLEADEAFGTFRHLHLKGLLVTNIDVDHLDYYGNVAALEEAFALVANRTCGPVIGCIDDAGVRRLAGRAPLVTYGLDSDSTWVISDVDYAFSRVSFTLSGPLGSVRTEVPQPGFHVASNAAGVLVLLAELGHDLEMLSIGLAEFSGVRRRFEILAHVGDVTIVDDYAHHPTEVGVTIRAGAGTTDRRVVAVFQPHRYSRTADLAPDFGAPLALADHVIVTDVYAAGEAPQPGVNGRLVAEAVAAAGGSVDYIPALRDVPEAVVSKIRRGDVVLLLGAGDVNTVAAELISLLEDVS